MLSTESNQQCTFYNVKSSSMSCSSS